MRILVKIEIYNFCFCFCDLLLSSLIQLQMKEKSPIYTFYTIVSGKKQGFKNGVHTSRNKTLFLPSQGELVQSRLLFLQTRNNSVYNPLT